MILLNFNSNDDNLLLMIHFDDMTVQRTERIKLVLAARYQVYVQIIYFYSSATVGTSSIALKNDFVMFSSMILFSPHQSQ